MPDLRLHHRQTTQAVAIKKEDADGEGQTDVWQGRATMGSVRDNRDRDTDFVPVAGMTRMRGHMHASLHDGRLDGRRNLHSARRARYNPYPSASSNPPPSQNKVPPVPKFEDLQVPVDVAEWLASAVGRNVSRESGAGGGGDKTRKGTYTCGVGGCGKLFARGEHLKRHIRSLHTYEKRAPSSFFLIFLPC